ncbi:MAG: NapC/NirT family cytochrome c [Alphaproteobacteria bacterium]
MRGLFAGIVFWGAFNTALELTNTETFCTSCHEMRENVFEELKTTIHYSNRSGVRAHCPDCHVPHNWTDKIARKMQASKEVWGKIFGTIDTRRQVPRSPARACLARVGAHEGRTTRSNAATATRPTRWISPKQSPRAADTAPAAAVHRQKTCIDCHKGIAHHLPDMRGVRAGSSSAHANGPISLRKRRT